MATKQSKSKVTEDKAVDITKPTVQEAPATSFDERTVKGQPWLNEDGTQERGDAPDGSPTI